MAVLTIETTGKMSIEDYSLRVIQKWGGGFKKNYGLVYTLAIKDRAMRFEVGTGLEELFTDTVIRSGIERLPGHLRDKDYDGAMNALIDFVEEKTAGQKFGASKKK